MSGWDEPVSGQCCISFWFLPLLTGPELCPAGFCVVPRGRQRKLSNVISCSCGGWAGRAVGEAESGIPFLAVQGEPLLTPLCPPEPGRRPQPCANRVSPMGLDLSFGAMGWQPTTGGDWKWAMEPEESMRQPETRGGQ